jgi:hypothetical protein
VSTPAILSALYAHLPDNGSEIVVFDVNRTIKFSMLLRASAETAVARIVPPAPRNYRVTVIGTVSPSNPATIARTTDAGQTSEQARELDLPYPAEIFSLSHVAIPFALDDSLYGLRPGPGAEYGANLGTIDARGERGALIVSVDFLARIASNPFFPYVLERIGDGIDKPAPRPAPAAKPSAPLPSPAVEDARSLGHAETVPQPMTDP